MAVRTITIKELNPKAWERPHTRQLWYTMVIEEYPSEPIRYIFDPTKNTPEPFAGETYTGHVYKDKSGRLKFYPFSEEIDLKSKFRDLLGDGDGTDV